MITSLQDGLKSTDVLSDIYLGCGDSTVHVVSRKMQVFSHTDSESVAIRRLVVQRLEIQERGELEFSPQQVKSKYLLD